MTERTCPNGCGPLEPYCEADIGVGVQTFGPWGCPACHWIEDELQLGIESTPLSDFIRSSPEEKQPILERAAAAPVEPHGPGCNEACMYYGSPHVVCIRVRFP